MQNTVLVCLGNFFGQQNALGEIFGNFARDQVALRRRGERVFIGVFLHHVLIRIADQA